MNSTGNPSFLMLWISLLMSTLGKAPLTSRKRAEDTWLFLQESLTVFTSKCTESVVVQPGLAPKWWSGNIRNLSHVITTMSAMHELRRWASLFERMIGHHADRDE